MRLLPYGPDAVLVELDSGDDVARLAAEIERRQPAGLVDVVPAARTVLLTGPEAAAVAKDLAAWPLPPVHADALTTVVLPVTWDGVDLSEVADHCGRPEVQVIGALQEAPLRVAFCGFAPGFAYLTGLPAWLRVPRRATPRTVVEAGSVGIAGEYAGVYPRRSPGGWQVVGRTDAGLWDPDRDPPALLTPGSAVRLVTTETAP